MEARSATGLLLGSDHLRYGEVAARPVGARAAVALSIGTHPKGYPAMDPNEDAVFAASDGVLTLLAVADGHNGFDAAAAAIGAIGDAGLAACAGEPSRSLTDLVAGAVAAVADAVTTAPLDRRSSRTTLTLAIVTDDAAWLVGHGDSAALVVGRRRARVLLEPRPFLGPETDPGSVAPVRARLRQGDSVVLATDGLMDFLGGEWRRILMETISTAGGATEAAGALVTAAGERGAGDNVAIALTLADGPRPTKV